MSIETLKISGENRQQLRQACHNILGELDRIEKVPVELKAGDMQFDNQLNAAVINIMRLTLTP